MAIYLKAVKASETKDAVLYDYGTSQHNLAGRFMIKRDFSDWKIISDAEVPVSGLIAKICKEYKNDSIFPDEISYEA